MGRSWDQQPVNVSTTPTPQPGKYPQHPLGQPIQPPAGQPQGPRYPGDTDWWRKPIQQPQMPNWGSPQFNYLGGNAPWAQPPQGPPFGGAGMTPIGQSPSGVYYDQSGRPLGNALNPAGQPGWSYGPSGGGAQNAFGGAGSSMTIIQPDGTALATMDMVPPSQQRTIYAGGGAQNAFGGMPVASMPNYQTPNYQNTAAPGLQQAIWQQQMLNQMPNSVAQQWLFNQATGQLGINPYEAFPYYGTGWGPTAPGQWATSGVHQRLLNQGVIPGGGMPNLTPGMPNLTPGMNKPWMGYPRF